MVVPPTLFLTLCSPYIFILLASLSTVRLQLWSPCSYLPNPPFQSCPVDLSTVLWEWVKYYTWVYFNQPKVNILQKEFIYSTTQTHSFLISFSILAVCVYLYHLNLVGLGIFFHMPFFTAHVQSTPKSSL